MSAAQGFDFVLDTVENFGSNLSQHHTLFVQEGQMLLGVLAAIAITWIALKSMLQGKPVTELVAELVIVIFTVGLISLTISQFAMVIDPIVKGFDWLAREMYRMGGAGVAGETSSSPIRNSMSQLVKSVLDLWKVNTPDFHVGDSEETGAWGWLMKMVVGSIGELVMAAANMLLRLFMAIALLAFVMVFMAVYITAQTMIQFAVILAPILVPFYLIQPLSFLAEGWFKFLIVAGMQKVAATFIVALSGGMIQQVTQMSAAQDVSIGHQFGLFAGMFLLMGVMGMLMMQAMSIGSGIVSGTNRAGLQMPSKLTPGGAMNAASSSVQQAGGAMMRGAGQTAGYAGAVGVGVSSGLARSTGAAGGRWERAKTVAQDGLRGYRSARDVLHRTPSTAGGQPLAESLNPLRVSVAMTRAAQAHMPRWRNPTATAAIHTRGGATPESISAMHGRMSIKAGYVSGVSEKAGNRAMSRAQAAERVEKANKASLIDRFIATPSTRPLAQVPLRDKTPIQPTPKITGALDAVPAPGSGTRLTVSQRDAHAALIAEYAAPRKGAGSAASKSNEGKAGQGGSRPSQTNSDRPMQGKERTRETQKGGGREPSPPKSGQSTNARLNTLRSSSSPAPNTTGNVKTPSGGSGSTSPTSRLRGDRADETGHSHGKDKK